ncbi:hypothetical protein HF520_06380 [Romboutsia sp. CE17]|uniref:hypothetical protein n=1 Tax=Romboutsia sp. CE17 TaxID=2724150 RepID=UPI001442D8A1|nr:hypothetical protein [Romboutsia sp. CE17]QJA08590.1 hypothetical protein HF520_06380 [Romboutsia sp. CE17]
MNYTVFIVLVCYFVYFLRMAYLIGVKEEFSLIYSIDQVKMLQNDSKKRLKIARYIALVYVIIAIGLLVTGYNDLIKS